ncbi:MAG: cysteinyl-tRNA synthetase [Solirubrobacterales bacterium]|nr:cysteinyl-tRNA synthetase [Solirubrobacterales bacterium]
MRKVRLNDTLSGELRELEPRRGRGVGIYACGPTTYARIHVGNARPYVVFQALKRFLAHEGYEPRLVINVTDINDKIYDAARVAGVPSVELAAEMTRLYREDTDRLGLGRPDAEPLASETIGPIVELIEALIASGHAYESGGDVYFKVRGFEGYGKLSNRRTDDMDQGEEAGSASLKQDPLDFALWKATKEGEDSSWEAPWSRGRPGWHIECSAMAEAELGVDFEVHGGGVDLIFPHHENEIAQTEAARGAPLARIWMHNGMVQIADEKMSKSVGNIFQLSSALDAFGPAAMVAYLLSGHYRQPLAFSEEALAEAAARCERIRNYLRSALAVGAEGGEDPFVGKRREAFFDALADDFNTPRALAAVAELVAEGNRRELPGARPALEEMLTVVGLEALLSAEDGPDADAERLLAEREAARAAREFERADEIRDELAARGWEVRDSAEGARLVRR